MADESADAICELPPPRPGLEHYPPHIGVDPRAPLEIEIPPPLDLAEDEHRGT